MKRDMPGFSIVEYVVYAAVSYLVLSFFIGMVWKIYNGLSEQSASHRMHVSLAIAKDQMRRDLWQAPSDTDAWVCVKANTIIWRVNASIDRGYAIDRNRLVRLEGAYDKKNNRWHKKASSLVLSDVKSGSFVLIKDDNQVVACSLTICAHNGKCDGLLNETVLLRNHTYDKGAT